MARSARYCDGRGCTHPESDYTGKIVGCALIDSMMARHNARNSLKNIVFFVWLPLVIR